MRFLLAMLLLANVGCLAGVKQPYTDSLQAWKTTAVESAVVDPFAANEQIDLEILTAEVLVRNPNAEVARQSWRAALAMVPTAAALSDPMVMLSTAPASLVDANVRNGAGVQLTQRIPFPGTRRLAASRAMAHAHAAALSYEQTRIELAHTTAVLYADYYFVDQSLRINDEHVQLLRELRRTATARFTAGTTSMTAPLQAETELGHLIHRDAVLRSTLETVRARINIMLHREPSAPLPTPAALSVPSRPALEAGEGIEAQPEIRALIEHLRADELSVALERRRWFPDFTVTGTYSSMWPMPTHQWMVGVGLTLPLQARARAAGVARASATHEASKARLAAGLDQARLEVHVARTRLAEQHEIVEIFQERVLPSSRDRVVAARSGFETGRNSFLDLIDAQKTLLNDELGYHQAIAIYHQRSAELARALGDAP